MYPTITFKKNIFRSFVPTPTPNTHLSSNQSSPSYTVSVHTLISNGSERRDSALRSDLLWFISRFHNSRKNNLFQVGVDVFL